LVEAAVILPVFLTFLFVLFEVAYDQFLQGSLESAVQLTAYEMQVGYAPTGQVPIDSSTSAQTFVDNYLCSNAIAHLLSCGSLFVRVQQFTSPYLPNSPGTSTCTDIYQDTDGTLPVANGVLQLGYYAGETTGSGNKVGPTGINGAGNCNSNATTGGVGYCNPGPNQFIIMTAIYVAPSFLQGLIPGNAYSYGGRIVRAAYASSAFYTENFALTNPPLPC
jgi:hypothetical protein